MDTVKLDLIRSRGASIREACAQSKSAREAFDALRETGYRVTFSRVRETFDSMRVDASNEEPASLFDAP